MKEALNRINVFVASPGDVESERNQLPKVIQEINLIISAIAPEKKVILDLIRWETHAFPTLEHNGPQAAINQQLPEYDIFIGIMWKRFGTPTKVADSGTEEEFNIAHSKWLQDDKLPVLFYFCQQSYPPFKSTKETEQYMKVLQFKESLSNKGLIWEYNDHTEFANVIRPHLILTLSKILATRRTDRGTETTPMLTTQSDLSLVRQRVQELSLDYDNLRNSMRYSKERTKLMSVVESRMRAMALQTVSILPELTKSGSARDRLAAIATLKEIPDSKYLDWLTDRVGKPEKDFIGFHASLALLAAARTLTGELKAQVKTAVEGAMYKLNSADYKDPNQVQIIQDAINLLKD